MRKERRRIPSAGRPRRPGVVVRRGVSITEALEQRLLFANNITVATGGLTSIPAGASTFSDFGNYTIDPSALNNASSNILLDATNNITFQNSVSLTTVGVTLSADARQQVFANAAIQTNGADVSLFSEAGGLALTAPVNAGSGTVRLRAGGAIVQIATAMLSSANLLLQAAGNIDLSSATNAVPGTFAASDSAAGAHVRFLDGQAITVGQVPGDALVGAAFGVSTSSGDVSLASPSGPISLGNGIQAVGATVRLQAGATITQSALGAITAANLSAQAPVTIDLSKAANNVAGAFAAETSAMNAAVHFHNASAITVGNVPADALVPAVNGVMTMGSDLSLVAQGGAVTFASPVNIGMGILRISAAGPVAQTAAGGIMAGCLSVVVTAGNVDLTGAMNDVDTIVAAQDMGAGASFRFAGASGFSVGTIPGDGFTSGATGINTASGDVSIAAQNGLLALSNPINAGSGTVRLSAGTAITQVSNAAITAANLSVLAGGNVDLEAQNSITGMFAAADSGTPGFVRLVNNGAITIGSVSGDSVINAVAGIATTNSDVSLASPIGPITLIAPVNAGTGTVRLSAAGPIAQAATGTITGINLAVRATGNIDLTKAANAVNGMFAAADSGSGAYVHFVDGSPFAVGSIAGDAVVVQATNGVATTNADVSLVNQSGGLTLTAPINVGTGIVRLSTGSTIGQSGSAPISAGCLAIVAAGNVNLYSAGNNIASVFAAVDSAPGALIQFLNNVGFAVDTIPGDGIANGAMGVTTNGGNVTLQNWTGALTVNQPINAGNGSVILAPEAGDVNDGASITARTILQRIGSALSTYSGALHATGADGIDLSVNGLSITGGVTVDAGPLAISNNGTATVLVPIQGNGGLTKSNPGTLVLANAHPLNAGPLKIGPGSMVKITGGGSEQISSLFINGGSLDLGTSTLTINFAAAAADPAATIRSYLKSAALFSSAADASHALGYTDGGELSPPSNALTIKLTVPGDANLDGSVNFLDLMAVARHYGQSGANWDQGDFNYDGTVNLADLLAVAHNYGRGVTTAASAAAQPAAIGSDGASHARHRPHEIATHRRARRADHHPFKG